MRPAAASQKAKTWKRPGFPSAEPPGVFVRSERAASRPRLHTSIEQPQGLPQLEPSPWVSFVVAAAVAAHKIQRGSSLPRRDGGNYV